MGEIKNETLLYREAYPESKEVGKLPSGTVFTFLGEKENNFAKVRVELQDGQEIEGWISANRLVLPKENAKTVSDDESEVIKEKPKEKPKAKSLLKRGAVPADEASLLRRDPTFQYGIYGGPIIGFLSHQFADGFYNGVGFMGGGFLGYYLDKGVVLRSEVGYQLVNGTGADGILSFGLLDIGVVAEYIISRFLLFASLRYDIGVGIGDIPSTVLIGTAADLSSIWCDFGAGFQFRLTDVSAFVIRAKYGFSFSRLPVAFSGVGILGYLEIRG